MDVLLVNFEKAVRNLATEIESENFDNVQLIDAWFDLMRDQQQKAKCQFDHAHQKVREGEAERVKILHAIDLRQQEIDRKREEKIQKRKIISVARKALEAAKLENEAATKHLRDVNESYDNAVKELTKFEQVSQAVMRQYHERLGLEFSVVGPEVAILFTHLSAVDPSAVHRVVLKKHRSAYKVATCEPAVSVSKVDIDSLNKEQRWRQFLISVRGRFLSLYEQERE